MKLHTGKSGRAIDANEFNKRQEQRAMKKKQTEDVRVKVKKEARWLPYHYHEAEIHELGKVLASLAVRCVEMNQELELLKSGHRNAEKDKEKEVTGEETKRNEMAGNIKRGFERRDIECEIRYDYDTNIKTIVRLDTGEVVEDGIIPEHERQIPLPLEDGIEQDTEPKAINQ